MTDQPAPKSLNPNDPVDALQIIDMVTADMPVGNKTRRDILALQQSLMTLDQFVKAQLAQLVKPEPVTKG